MRTLNTLARLVRRHPYRAAAALVTVARSPRRSGSGSARSRRAARRLATPRPRVVVDRHGVPLYEALSGDGTRSIRLDGRPAAADPGGGDGRGGRSPVLSHPASIRWRSLRALERNIVERQVVEGGSTITQQTAKLLLSRKSPARSRGVLAKIQEAVLALASRASLRQASDPRDLLEPRCLRQPDGRRGPGEPRLLRPRCLHADAGAGGVPRRPAAAPVGVQPVPQSEVGAGAPADRPAPHGGRRRHHPGAATRSGR